MSTSALTSPRSLRRLAVVAVTDQACGTAGSRQINEMWQHGCASNKPVGAFRQAPE